MARKFNLPSLVGPKEKQFPLTIEVVSLRCSLTKDAVRTPTSVINRWEGDNGAVRIHAQAAYFPETGREHWHLVVWVKSSDVRVYGVGATLPLAIEWLGRKLKETRLALKYLRP